VQQSRQSVQEAQPQHVELDEAHHRRGEQRVDRTLQCLEPFAEVGDTVKKGQVLCIIEAMKLMNEINAECDGEVVKVYVENGQAVQYGERLFALKPA